MEMEPREVGDAAPQKEAPEPARTSVPRILPYSVACLIVATASGGLILGVGPFGNQIVRDGYLRSEDVSRVFTGAFQIMTWGSIIAVIVENRLGPRISAAFGACLALTGHALLAHLPAPADRDAVMVAYGFLGWGGSHIYISSFQFAQLFAERVGVADGILSGLFNSSALIFLAFNLPSMTIRRFFRQWTCVEALALVLILVFWPDKPYTKGEQAFVARPTLRSVKCRWNRLAQLRAQLHSVVGLRFVLYVLTFSWSCAITQYTMGQLPIYHQASVVGEFYSEWAFPLITSPTILFTWLVGYTIDKTGFAWVSLLLIICGQASLLCLLLSDSVIAAWCNLLLVNVMSALQYTIEFVFIHKNFQHDKVSFGLVIVLIVQGLVGFVPTALSPNPWGRDFAPPLLILAVPTVALYLWPLYEWRHQHRQFVPLEKETP